MITVGILTASDKCSLGLRVDESGKVIADMIKQINGKVEEYIIVPDERNIISENLIRMADKSGLDLVLTTGGTGFSPRDITPEATLDVIEKQIPGIPEAMRFQTSKATAFSILSRAVAGIRRKTIIINLPGSPKGAGECLETVLPVLEHAVKIVKGEANECAQSLKSEQ